MLTLTTKEYEIEEEIEVKDNKGEVVYSFTMQITPNELKQINEILINEESIKLSKNMSKLEANSEDSEELQNKILKLAKKNQDMFENICFKEHKKLFKEATGEYKYMEMVEIMFGFFWKSFIGKRTQLVNTMSSDLKKIGKN